MIEQHYIGPYLTHNILNFFRLAGTNEITGVGRRTGTSHGRHRLDTSGNSQISKFLQLLAISFGGEIKVDENSTLATLWTFKQLAPSSA
jgi:hypothetical protein